MGGGREGTGRVQGCWVLTGQNPGHQSSQVVPYTGRPQHRAPCHISTGLCDLKAQTHRRSIRMAGVPESAGQGLDTCHCQMKNGKLQPQSLGARA